MKKRIKRYLFFFSGFVIGASLLSFFSSSLFRLPDYTVHAADYIFGTDPQGNFVIRDKDTGLVKLRIDSTGTLIAPIKGMTSGENLVPNNGFEYDVDGDGEPDN